MNLMEGRRRAFRLIEAARGSLWVVSMDQDTSPETACLYTESPEELALKDGEPQYYLIRVFTTQHEADAYRDAIKSSYQQLNPSLIEYKSFEELYPALKDAERTYQRAFQLPVRAVLSEMPDGSWPKGIVTIFPAPSLRN